MTNMDERLARLESLIEQIDALVPATRALSATPASVNPDGSPGLVAAGELIESAWGNAVSNEFARVRAWGKQVNVPVGPFTNARADYPNLAVAVPFAAGRIYQVTAFVPKCDPVLAGTTVLYIANGAGTILNTAETTTSDGERHTMECSLLLIGPPAGTQTIKVMMSRGAGGSVSVAGTSLSELLVTEVSKAI